MARYSLVPPERLEGDDLAKEAEQTLASWGLTGVSFKLCGNRVRYVVNGEARQCMRWDFISELNELALESL
jgi:hypothetical protein